MTDQQNEQSPYVEDKTFTWRSLSLGKRVGISAGALAVGAFALAGPAMPVIAQMVGIVDPATERGPAGNPAGIFGAPVDGLPVADADPLPNGGPEGGFGIAELAPNIQTVPPTSILPQNPGGHVVLPQNPSAVDFGNVSSATPGGSTWSGDDDEDDDDDDDDEHEGREHHGDRGEHEDHDD